MSNSAPDPSKPICELVPGSLGYRRVTRRSLRLDDSQQKLVIDLQGEGFSFARVVFRNVAGFRLLDEGALLEFWNEYSEPNGWLWEVKKGGWLDLERTRPAAGYWLGLVSSPPLREFFLVDDLCVNVLCAQPPEILDLGKDPPQD